MSKKISIVIPVFNREQVLKETLNSVLGQTYANWECIIVDDGSTDNSVSVIKQFQLKDSRFQLYARLDSNKPKGVSSCRNIGIEKVTGKFVIFLDSDDLLSSTCLEKRLEYQHKTPKFDFWIFKMQEFNEQGKGELCNLYPKEDTEKEYLKMILNGNIPFSVTCPLWKLNVLKELNGFDETLQRLEDPDLHARALLKGYKIKVDKEAKADCFYRVDTDSIKRYTDINFIRNIQDSYIAFINKHASVKNIQTVLHNVMIREELAILTKYMFRHYVLPFNDKKGLLKIIKTSSKLNLLSLKERGLILILFIFKYVGFSKVKGSGYFKIRNYIFNGVS